MAEVDDATVAAFGGLGRCRRNVRTGAAWPINGSGVYVLVGSIARAAARDARGTSEGLPTAPGMPTMLPWRFGRPAARLLVIYNIYKSWCA